MRRPMRLLAALVAVTVLWLVPATNLVRRQIAVYERRR